VSGGAGLGLSIVREITNAHQGSISVEANPNGGTIFTLQFPDVRDKNPKSI
jgi:two-component system, OmpR family, phosphate regulon sensor histidine kinase PhoR